jgi:hypothetical protein
MLTRNMKVAASDAMENKKKGRSLTYLSLLPFPSHGGSSSDLGITVPHFPQYHALSAVSAEYHAVPQPGHTLFIISPLSSTACHSLLPSVWSRTIPAVIGSAISCGSVGIRGDRKNLFLYDPPG